MRTDDLNLDGYPLYYRPSARVHAAQEAQRRRSDAASAAARDRYEVALMAEARAIVAGTSQATPQREHLRLLLETVDGFMSAAQPPQAAF
jgi:hypothetical protein